MKKAIHFAALLGAAAAFLSCSTEGNEVNPSCKILAKQEVPDYIKESDGYKQLDPVCKSEDRKVVSFYIYDYSSLIDWDYVYSHLPNYVPGSGQVGEQGSMSQGKVSYNVNGIEMDQEQFDAYRAEYSRKYEEEVAKSQSQIQIPCVVTDTDTSPGLALLTDEQITDLKGKYEYLFIADYNPLDFHSTGEASSVKGCGK